MGERRSFRPVVGEALEERVVLSHGGVTGTVVHQVHGAAAGGRAVPNVNNTPPALGPVGALGDDFTDEYQFYPPFRSVARNWVEILHATRTVSFGPFSFRSRGAPRDQGFAYNWAQSGATSSDMVLNQLPGLAAQVAAGDVRYVSVFIGTNDFLQFLGGVQAGLIPPSQALPTLVKVTTQAGVNFATAVETLLAASPTVQIVAFTIPDVTLSPLARLGATTPQAQLLLAATSQAIGQYNDAIRALAATNPRIAVADLAAATAQAAASPTGTLSFGGQTINLLTAGSDYHDFFLADGAHVGTVGQGIIADLFTLALDDDFGGQTFPPTPQEIATYARVVQRHTQHGHLSG